MAGQEGKYNIKAVSKMLGIQPGTLRAWERRYQMIAPVRNEAGHRLYTEGHLSILKWLIGKVNQGFTISQAVALMEKKQVNKSIFQQENNEISSLSDELLDALIHFNEVRAQELINKCMSLYTTDKVLVDILGSQLVKIGDLWEEGLITSAHEHFATALLRSRIGNIMHSFPINALLPKVVSVCAPGEWHEMGLLIFTLFLRRKGFEVIYLGPSIAEKDMDVALETINPKFLFMSCTLKENASAAINLAERLSADYEFLIIGMGGNAMETLSQTQKSLAEQYIVGSTSNEWEEWLKEKIHSV